MSPAIESPQLILDHLFLLVSPGAPEASSLLDAGYIEGTANTHPGQGTANRRFFFDDIKLELLYLTDNHEARTGVGQPLQLADRWHDPEASKLGLVFRHPAGLVPFEYWSYFPDYFNGALSFPVGANSEQRREPLLICMPHTLPAGRPSDTPVNTGLSLQDIVVQSTITDCSDVLQSALTHSSIRFSTGHPSHHVTLALSATNAGQATQVDVTPQLQVNLTSRLPGV